MELRVSFIAVDILGYNNYGRIRTPSFARSFNVLVWLYI